jgi:hypothetical protein
VLFEIFLCQVVLMNRVRNQKVCQVVDAKTAAVQHRPTPPGTPPQRVLAGWLADSGSTVDSSARRLHISGLPCGPVNLPHTRHIGGGQSSMALQRLRVVTCEFVGAAWPGGSSCMQLININSSRKRAGQASKLHSCISARALDRSSACMSSAD